MEDHTCLACIQVIQIALSMVFPFITCQYIPPLTPLDNRKKVFWVVYAICFTLIVGISLNLWPTIIFITDWVKCPIRYYGICYSLELHSKDPNSPLIPDIILKNADNDMTAYNPGEWVYCYFYVKNGILLLLTVTISYYYLIYRWLFKWYWNTLPTTRVWRLYKDSVIVLISF